MAQETAGPPPPPPPRAPSEATPPPVSEPASGRGERTGEGGRAPPSPPHPGRAREESVARRSVRLLGRATDAFLNKIFAFESIFFGKSFDYAMSVLALVSVALVFLDLFGIKRLFGVRVAAIDYAIFAVFFVEYMFRILFAPSMVRYVKQHWYDPPGMLPLLLFEQIPSGGPLGLIRLLRLFRLLVLLRAEFTKRFLKKYLSLLAEAVSEKVMVRVLDMAQRRINQELAGRRFDLKIKEQMEKGREEMVEVARKAFAGVPVLETAVPRSMQSAVARRMSDVTIQLTVRLLQKIEIDALIQTYANRVIEEMRKEIARKGPEGAVERAGETPDEAAVRKRSSESERAR